MRFGASFYVTWFGLDWIGLDWIGLDWIGLDSSTKGASGMEELDL